MSFGEDAKRGLAFASIHGAKGMEADYVVLLGCVGGLFGFPSAILDDELLDIVSNHKQDTNEKLEEERRLFYVALTRCRKQLYIFTSEVDRSPFLAEIDELRHRDDGYCIRSGHRIPFNKRDPLCPSCRRTWDRYKRKNYPEKWCHSCGEPAETSFARPLCIRCWRKSR